MSETRRRTTSPRQYGVTRRSRKWLGVVPAALLLLVTGCGSQSQNTVQGTTNGEQLVVPKHVASAFAPSSALTSSWLKSDAQQKTVALTVTLAANQLALNGYSHGFAEVDVPAGWTVTVRFKNNNSILPGGLMVVKPADLVSAKKVSPAIAGATMKQPYQGIGLNQTETFSFQTGTPGSYVLESVPSAVSGTWMWFEVTSQSGVPAVLLKHPKS